MISVLTQFWSNAMSLTTICLSYTLSIVAIILSLVILFVLGQRGKSLNYRLITSLGLGILFGGAIQLWLDAETITAVNNALQLISGIYFSLLKMLVIPLILFSIIHAILNFTDASGDSRLSKIAIRSVVILLVTTSLAAGIGALVTTFLHVGQGLNLANVSDIPKHTYTGFVDTILGMLPSNPIQAMTEQNTVAIVILAVFIGYAALKVFKDESDHINFFKQWIASVFSVVKQITRIVVGLTPFGVFALVAEVVSTNGAAAFESLALYMLAIYVAMLLVIMMHCLILAARGYNPIHYFKQAAPALLVAFTSRSSFATLPVTEETLKNRFGKHQLTSAFVPSIGATMGMNACAGIFPAIVVVMTLQALGQPITGVIILKVMLLNAIASLGISGIPGTAFVAASVTLSLLGLPFAMLGIVQSVDPIVDMGRTATNVNGAMTAALAAEPNEK